MRRALVYSEVALTYVSTVGKELNRSHHSCYMLHLFVITAEQPPTLSAHSTALHKRAGNKDAGVTKR